MNTPIPVQKAYELLQFRAGHPPRAPLSEVDNYVLERLEREGVTEITPQDFLDRRSYWEKRRCKACGYGGRVGSALDGTLRLCACEHGGDLRLRNGEALLKAETERVNSSLHNRLLESCKEQGLLGPQTALEQGVAEEVDGTIRVSTGRFLRGWVKDADFQPATRRIGVGEKAVSLLFVPSTPDAGAKNYRFER